MNQKPQARTYLPSRNVVALDLRACADCRARVLPDWFAASMASRAQCVVFDLPYAVDESDCFPVLSSPAFADAVSKIVSGIAGDGRHHASARGFSPRVVRAVGAVEKLLGNVTPRPEKMAAWEALTNYAEAQK